MRLSCSSLVCPGSSGRPLTISANMQPTPLPGAEREEEEEGLQRAAQDMVRERGEQAEE